MKETLPLNAMRAFEAVHRTGGIRPAARELQIAHSSVSRHIAELEAWIGTDLITRTAGQRGIELTDAGQRLGQATRSAFADILDVTRSIRDEQNRDTVMLSTTPSFAARWLLPRLSEFSQRFANIRVSISIDQRVLDLDEAGIDLAIRMGRGPWPGVDCRPIMDDCLFPVIGRDLHERTGRPHSIAALVGTAPDLPFLHDLDPQATWTKWQEEHGHMKLAGVDMDKGPRLASSDLVLRAAALGQGIALARKVLAHDDITNGTLVRIGKDESVIEDAFWLVSRRRVVQNPAINIFVKWLRQVAAQSLPLQD